MKVEKPLTIAAPKHELVKQQQQLQMQNRKTSVWTREKINQLIELYKKHECLWNHWHEAYKSKDKRNRAIEDICKTLNVEKFEFGKKIHNLRNQFNTEMKKLEQRIEEAGVSINDTNDTELRCKWSHFESLMFLRNVIEPRPGGYQTTFQTPKKMRLKLDFNSSDDDVNITTVLPNSSGSSNTTNPEDLSQFQYEDNVNEEVITDDFQSFENEEVEVDQPNCEEICDRKYQPQQREISSVSTRSLVKSAKNKRSLHLPQTSSSCCSQTNNNNEGSSIELNSNNVTVVPSHSQIHTTASSPLITTPVISSITSSNSSNRPVSILRDQWDAFGELVANEFRYLNSVISRKRLKRKIMQAMLEVGEEDDHLMTNRSRST